MTGRTRFEGKEGEAMVAWGIQAHEARLRAAEGGPDAHRHLAHAERLERLIAALGRQIVERKDRLRRAFNGDMSSYRRGLEPGEENTPPGVDRTEVAELDAAVGAAGINEDSLWEDPMLKAGPPYLLPPLPLWRRAWARAWPIIPGLIVLGLYVASQWWINRS
jgi:hypothetical protein